MMLTACTPSGPDPTPEPPTSDQDEAPVVSAQFKQHHLEKWAMFEVHAGLTLFGDGFKGSLPFRLGHAAQVNPKQRRFPTSLPIDLRMNIRLPF